MKGINITNAYARIADKTGVLRVLHTLPNNAEIIPLLGTTFERWRYDQQQRRDFWIYSDGDVLSVLGIDDISEEESSRVRTFAGNIYPRVCAVIRGEDELGHDIAFLGIDRRALRTWSIALWTWALIRGKSRLRFPSTI